MAESKRVARGTFVVVALAAILAAAQPSWSATAWSKKTVSGPTPRWGAASAYLPGTGVVLFGGCAEALGNTQNPCPTTQTVQDTWVWNGTSWSQRTPATKPSVRLGATMGYDPVNGRLILFGGMTGGSPGTLRGDTWAFNGSTWSQLSPTTVPAARVWTAMAVDDTSRLIMFGGCGGVNPLNNTCNSFRNDTWRWTGSNWSSACTSPCASVPAGRQVAHMAKDPGPGGKVILFGGTGSAWYGDTWVWDGTFGTWAQLVITGAPSARAAGGFAPVLHGAEPKLLLYGGGNGPTTLFSETWFYDSAAGGAGTWTKCTNCNNPTTGRALMGFAEQTGNKVLLFGGIKSDNQKAWGETWVFQ